MIIHAVLGTAAVILGLGLFLYFWLNPPNYDNKLISILIDYIPLLLTGGVVTVLYKKVLPIREAMNEGKDLLATYVEAKGPPPHAALSNVTDLVLKWLGGKDDDNG